MGIILPQVCELGQMTLTLLALISSSVQWECSASSEAVIRLEGYNNIQNMLDTQVCPSLLSVQISTFFFL